MLSIAGNILPIFFLILIGFLFKQSGFPGNKIWVPAERLAYYVLLPALIIRNLTNTDLSTLPTGPMALTILSLGASMTLIILIIKPILKTDNAAFTSILQGGTRINAYICFAVADALYGPSSIALCAYFIAIMMPFLNTIIVTFMAFYGEAQKPTLSRVLIEVARNPIILACGIGWLINTLGIPIPNPIMNLLEILDRATLPIALLCVGAGLVVERSALFPVSVSVLLKLCCMPAIAYGLSILFGIYGLPLSIIILFSGAPTSPASYVLARQMGGDGPLMAAIISAQTVIAMLTLPIILSLVFP